MSNSTEAGILFNLLEVSPPDGPVLLEAFHSRFYPARSYFRSLVDLANVSHVNAVSMVPWWATSKDDIHFDYNLSVGSMMAMGT